MQRLSSCGRLMCCRREQHQESAKEFSDREEGYQVSRGQQQLLKQVLTTRKNQRSVRSHRMNPN